MNGLKAVSGYVRRHHVGLIALVLLLAGGTAYAGALSKNSVRSPQIKNGQVRSVDLRNNGVKGVDIRNGTLGTVDFGVGSVTGDSIAADSVGRSELLDDSVGADEIENGSVGSDKIADGSVGADEISDGSVGADELDPDSVGDLISYGGSFANDDVYRELLAVPGLGTLEGKCSAGNSFSVRYVPAPGVTQQVQFFAEDPIDGSPKVGTGSLTDTPVGGGGAPFTRINSEIWTYTDEKVVRIELSGTENGACFFSALASVDSNEG